MTESTWKNAHAAAVLQGAAAVVLLGIGAWQGLSALSSPQGWQRLESNLTPSAFLSGRLTGAVNQVLAHQLPADPLLRGAGAAFRYNLFGSGGPQVRVGCGETLFLTEELRPWPGAEQAMAERADGVLRLREALGARGIQLSVAVVPDKARVQAAALCGAPRSSQSADRYDTFVQLLQGRGVQPISLLPPLSEQEARGSAYYRTDTHWNQQGARAAAVAIARSLEAAPLSREDSFRTTAAAEQTEGPGDLLRLTSLDQVPAPLRPRPDHQHLERTEAAGEQGGGLLDEARAPEVALIGSSYSVNANFHGALQEALRSAVLNAATAGGGFSGSAISYFAGESFRQSAPRLVIWEIPERVVAQPITEAERRFILSPGVEGR
ncbi:cell division protein FtsQ [Roseomonas sp. SSH11]|uniref:Cell division protein FtsQ n=1 Tax=Pararoseomonas baculiformis TaxID=2820812 RepID=A0ABS4AAJ6_9PROT|nr:cell division protein FtsQ [Pararoseomonas baculiformis]MBP0444029.1 cell division protein FtsQ [Pararoseomonas baculiformis]